VWRPYAGGVAAGGTGSGTVTCPAGDTPFGADFFDNPGVGKYLNGARTFTGAGQSDAFRVAVPTTNPYMIEVSVDQGAITVTSESSSGRRSETFTENRNFALGTLSPGTTLLTVAPEPGPQARYHLRLVRAPLQLYDLGRDRSAVQPGQSITQKFSFDGPATVTALVLRVPSRGGTVRTILRDEHFEPGLHTIRWDGLDDAGQPLPDGVYSLSIRYRDSDGVADDSLLASGSITSLRRLRWCRRTSWDRARRLRSACSIGALGSRRRWSTSTDTAWLGCGRTARGSPTGRAAVGESGAIRSP